MKVALVTHSYLPNFLGGRETFANQLAKNTLRVGIDCQLFVGDKVKRPTSNVFDGIKTSHFPMKTIKFGNIPYRVVSPSFLKALHVYNPDVIHALDYRHFTTDLAYLYCKLYGKPLVISIHGLGYAPPFKKIFSLLLRCYDHTIGPHVLRNANSIIAYPYQDSLEPVIKYHAKNIYLIQGAIDIESIENPPYTTDELRDKFQVDAEHIILAIGRSSSQKGFEFLIDAFKTGIKNAFLLMITSKLNVKMPRHSLITGALSYGWVKSAYNASSLFCQSSLFETCGRSLLESMVYRNPVVTTKTGIASDIIKPFFNGVFIRKANSKDIFLAIKTLLEDDSTRLEMGLNARETVLKFDWKNTIYDFVKVYRDVLK